MCFVSLLNLCYSEWCVLVWAFVMYVYWMWAAAICVWQCVRRGWVMMCVMKADRDGGCLMKRVVCLCRHVNPHSLLKTGYELIWSDTRTRFPATSVANFSPLLTSQITWGSITNPSITSVTSATAVSIIDYFISGLKSIAVLLIIYYPYVYLPRLHLFDQFSKKIYIYCEIL